MNGFWKWLRTWWSSLLAGGGFAVVAGVTGRISYVHIQALTLALHQPASLAQIMPFGVDGLIVVGSVALLQAGDTQPWVGWVCVVPGAIVSLFANVWSYISYGWLSAAWAGVASMSFIVATFTLERWLKAQFKRPTQGGSGTPGEPSPEAFPGAAGGGRPEVPHPLSTLEALGALLDSEKERELAFLLKVDRNKIRAWKGQLDAADGEPGEDAPEDVPELPAGADQGPALAGLNGSGPHA